MKNIITSVLLLLAVVISSCQNFPTVKVDTEFEETFVISNTGATFGETAIIDATEDSDFDKYKRKLNKIEVERVTYTITNFNGPANQILQSGTLDVADVDGNGRVNILNFSNLNLAAATGQETDIQGSVAGLTRLQDLIKNDPNKATIIYAGNVNQGPIRMTVQLKFYSKLTARVIGKN